MILPCGPLPQILQKSSVIRSVAINKKHNIGTGILAKSPKKVLDCFILILAQLYPDTAMRLRDCLLNKLADRQFQ
jgi:hypothetical protein